MSRYFARTPDIQNCQHSVCIGVGTDWLPHGLPPGRAASRRGTEAAGRALSQGGPRACRAPATAEGRAPSHSPLPRGGGGRHGPRPSRAAPAAWTGRRDVKKGVVATCEELCGHGRPSGGGLGGAPGGSRGACRSFRGAPRGQGEPSERETVTPAESKGTGLPPFAVAVAASRQRALGRGGGFVRGRISDVFADGDAQTGEEMPSGSSADGAPEIVETKEGAPSSPADALHDRASREEAFALESAGRSAAAACRTQKNGPPDWRGRVQATDALLARARSCSLDQRTSRDRGRVPSAAERPQPRHTRGGDEPADRGRNHDGRACNRGPRPRRDEAGTEGRVAAAGETAVEATGRGQGRAHGARGRGRTESAADEGRG